MKIGKIVHKRFLFTLIGMMIAAILLPVFFFQMSDNEDKNKLGRIESRLRELSQPCSAFIESSAEGVVAHSSNIALLLALGDDLASEESGILLNQLESFYRAADVFIIKPGGTPVFANELGQSLREELNASAAFAGKAALSKVFTAYENSRAFVFMTPIVKSNRVIGVLAEAFDTGLLSRNIYSSLYDGEGSLYIFEADGSFVLTSPSTRADTTVSGIFQMDALPIYEDINYDKMRTDIEARRSGYFSLISADNVPHYVYYTPLNIDDWYSAITVPTDFVDSSIQTESQVSASLALKILLTFCILAFCIVIDFKRNASRLKLTNSELDIIDQRLRIAVSHIAELVFEYNFDSNSVIILHEHPSIKRIPLHQHEMTLESWSLLLHPDDSEMMVSLRERMISGEAVVSAAMRMKSQDDRDEDGCHWYRLTFTCVYEAGKPLRSIGTLEDIADQKLLQKQAQRDPLTGVLNRAEFEKRLETELELCGDSPGYAALLLLDLDDFKSINDTSSHLYGDKVLQALTYQLRQVFRSNDIIGRLGGDEFLVFLKEIPGVEVVTRKIEELQTALSTGDGMDVTEPIYLSAGVVLSNSGDSFTDLYRKADVALYLAKNRGKNQYVVYES